MTKSLTATVFPKIWFFRLIISLKNYMCVWPLQRLEILWFCAPKKIVFCFPAVNVYIVCMLHYINSQLFFWDSESFILFSLSFYTLTEKIYFLTPPTPREKPPKKCYSIQQQYSTVLMGVLSFVAALLLYFHPPSPHPLFNSSARERRETQTNTSKRTRVEIFWKCFFISAEKIV